MNIALKFRHKRVHLRLESAQHFCDDLIVNERKQPLEESVWGAYGPEEDAWKKAVNYYTADELDAMERGFSDLVITLVPRKVYVAD